MRSLIRNVSFASMSNLVSLVVSVLIVAVVPKTLGVEDYGHFQLYLFYVGYVGFFQVGWIDGIYLRYGGRRYADLGKDLLYSQFWMLVGSQALIGILLNLYARSLGVSADKLSIVVFVSACILISNSRGMLSYVLQATFRIREYTLATVTGRGLFFLIVVALVVLGTRSYVLMICADLVGGCASLLVAAYYCRDIVFRNPRGFRFSMLEAWRNVSCGIKLMLACVANLLIIGTVRWGIENNWDVATFGRVSLTLSLSSLLTSFIAAVGIIVFPILKRAREENLPRIYMTLRGVITAPLFGVLALYYPVRELLTLWLPQYAGCLAYMALLFPMCLYTSKTYLLGNSYLNALRKEHVSLLINWVTVLLSLLVTYATAYVMHDLDMTVGSIVVLLGIRSVAVELYLARLMRLSIARGILYETILASVFITVGWAVGSWRGLGVYVAAFLVYLILIRHDLIQTIGQLRDLIRQPGVVSERSANVV